MVLGGLLWIEDVTHTRKGKVLETVVADHFSEDILFLSELLSALCVDDERVSEAFYFFQDEDLEPYAEEILGILVKISYRLEEARPNNLFQQKLKEGLVQAFEKYPVDQITAAEILNSEEALPEIEGLMSEIGRVFEECGFEQYVDNKIDNLMNLDLPVLDILSVRLHFLTKKKEIDARMAKKIVASIHRVAIQNDNYRQHYEGGCISILKNELTQFLITK